MKHLPIKTFVCLLGVTQMAANAAVLVAGTGQGSGFYDVCNSPAGGLPCSLLGAVSIEQLFTLSTTVQVTSITINTDSFTSQTLNVQLFSGLGLEGTGTLLQSFDITPAVMPGGSTPGTMPPTTTITSFSLAPGDYSLVLSGPAVPSNNLIYFATATSTNTPYGSLGGVHVGPFGHSPPNITFSIDGTVGESSAVPEPAPRILLATGVLAIGVLLRVRLTACL